MKTINTSRLILRPLNHGDLVELCMLQSDPDVMKYIGHGVRTTEEVKRTLDLCIFHQEQLGFGLYAVLDKENKTFIGRAGIIHLGLDLDAKDVELAFVFKTTHWNKGYGYETAKGLLDDWFENPNHHKVVAVARLENEPCIKLLKKLGMQFSHFEAYKDIPNVGYFTINHPPQDGT